MESSDDLEGLGGDDMDDSDVDLFYLYPTMMILTPMTSLTVISNWE